MPARPQPGIFALGTVEHCYVELDLVDAGRGPELVAALAALSGPETTVAGVSVVVAFRPELWASVAGPGQAPGGVASFAEIEGSGLRMPSTQHDAWLWVAGGSRDAVFDSTLRVVRALEPVATVASEVTGWLYQHDRDLTGFIDGTENPSMIEAPDVAVVPEGPGAGASVVLVQQWRHLQAFGHLPTDTQEKVIGRTKADSVELGEDVMPADSHVSRTVVVEDGRELQIYRRNTAYGGPTEHGTMFVAFCREQHPFDAMLRRMAGAGDGVRDALTRYTEPLTGAYYVAPSLDALAASIFG
jgi:putative iron-dependent peroxidase